VRRIFSALEGPLSDLVERIAGADKRPAESAASALRGSFDEEGQKRLSLMALEAMGFDFERGRLDVSTHPFTTTLGRSDVRLTTRYSREEPISSLFSSIHEGGHGLYELGFGDGIAGSVLADGTSLGIHESQSRMWENLVGRSRSFCRWLLSRVWEVFPGELSGVDAETLYRIVNRVEPTLIRVESDEITYNLHIILRFQMETALIGGAMSVDELPEAWSRKSEELLGIRPERDADGVLQDIHWSMGAFGYFPTYCLGNLYAAQLFSRLERDVPNLWSRIEAGDFSPLLDWLRGQVHVHGRVYPAEDLCRRITGTKLDPAFFLDYIRCKYGEIYGL